VGKGRKTVRARVLGIDAVNEEAKKGVILDDKQSGSDDTTVATSAYMTHEASNLGERHRTSVGH
jgi:hypothetical protein